MSKWVQQAHSFPPYKYLRDSGHYNSSSALLNLVRHVAVTTRWMLGLPQQTQMRRLLVTRIHTPALEPRTISFFSTACAPRLLYQMTVARAE